ncbi:cysteine proteinases superfamily protein [Striga asiatica]|uniref:Cysteine proteinases superfamily protein n=1 Tax=Striga asiatica TaxID=4170 RepID=A0A5A7R1I5_STRAF|nr:cysteine proteinases superfamily protein [Striga asiatica]
MASLWTGGLICFRPNFSSELALKTSSSVVLLIGTVSASPGSLQPEPRHLTGRRGVRPPISRHLSELRREDHQISHRGQPPRETAAMVTIATGEGDAHRSSDHPERKSHLPPETRKIREEERAAEGYRRSEPRFRRGRPTPEQLRRATSGGFGD